MTLHLIIFTSKGHCCEIKHRLIQNPSLGLKCPLEFASKKKDTPFISRMLVKLVTLQLVTQDS